MKPNIFIVTFLFIILLASCNNSFNKTHNSVFNKADTTNAANLERVTQKLVAPPALPEHQQIADGEPVVVKVELVVEEKKIEIAPGVFIWALTFNGTVPGPIIVVHENDYVELTLVNPAESTLLHNIDFHAASGAMGGGDLSMVAPGEQATFRFKATKPGVFVYHCAPGGMMVPLHVVLGMNGAIMVLPREGLKDENGNYVKYDKAWYIGEQDFYVPKDENGGFKDYDTLREGISDYFESMKTLIPTHIVFNGKVDALTGENSLKANVGDKVLFITSQANRDTRMHLIGGHADLLWQGGSFNDKPATNYGTWQIAGGSAVAALYEFRQPGGYIFLNHNLIEAFAFGAAAEVEISGDWNNNLMEQIEKPKPIENN